MSPKSLLTEKERAAIQRAGELYQLLEEIVAVDRNRWHDLAELAAHVHAIQHAVMAQAAARAYPDLYRLLGET